MQRLIIAFQDQEARRQNEERIYMENQTLYQNITKTSLYDHLAHRYKEKRAKNHQQQQQRRGGGGQLSPRKPAAQPPANQQHNEQQQYTEEQREQHKLQLELQRIERHQTAQDRLAKHRELEKRLYRGKTSV